jgi:dephospho-CoA kinase
MPDHTKPVIGIAGGIGSGKSTVARVLAELGCVVCDSDALGRAALRDPVIRQELVRWWGDDIVDARGEIDRGAVAAIVFRDPAERRRLEGLTHPWIEARRREQFAGAPDSATAFVIDAPLLYEVGLDAECDAVIFVETERAIRLDRLRASRRTVDRAASPNPGRHRQDHERTSEGSTFAVALSATRVGRPVSSFGRLPLNLR